MDSKKTSKNRYSSTEENKEKVETFVDNEFTEAFTKCSKVFEQLVKKVEKNPGIRETMRFAFYSQAFQGFPKTM